MYILHFTGKLQWDVHDWEESTVRLCTKPSGSAVSFFPEHSHILPWFTVTFWFHYQVWDFSLSDG